MNKIYKYPIAQTDEQGLTLPKGSQILSIINQYDKPVIYAIVDPNTKQGQMYNIRTIGTGHEIDDDLSKYTFIGTLSFLSGNLIFHYFIRLVSEA